MVSRCMKVSCTDGAKKQGYHELMQRDLLCKNAYFSALWDL